MYDIIIKNGTVIDGSGQPMAQRDVAIQDGMIVAVDDLSHEVAHEFYDAAGKYVMPGIIDVNNHSDAYWKIFDNPSLDSLVHQGVTTVIGGNSGASLAPLLTPEMIKGIQKWTDVSHVNINWRSMREFLEIVKQRGVATNFGTLVGHGTLRRAMLGDEQRELSDDELEQVAAVLDQALSEGAFGLSTALLYAHARSATHEELVRLAHVVAQHDGVYVAYLSDEMDGVLDALEDVIAIAREANVRIHIAHLKTVGQENWPLMHRVLSAIEDARGTGVRITSDVYPYTVMSAVLYTLLPDWVTDGGRTMMLARLKDAETRARVVTEMQAYSHINLADAVLSMSPLVKQVARRRLGDIAQVQERSVEEVVIDVLLASRGRAAVLLDAVGAEGLAAAVRDNNVMIASNGGGYRVEDWQTGEVVHPRNFGAFPRFFAQYVREAHDGLSWEAAVRKVTSLPAEHFGIAQRGMIAPRMIADIAIIDPETIVDHATLEQPYQYATGVDAVLVGGAFAMRDGMVSTGVGDVLRHAPQQ
jgi:N-acyl-D-amino-acid deacylase